MLLLAVICGLLEIPVEDDNIEVEEDEEEEVKRGISTK
jgi:hypothetical protein